MPTSSVYPRPFLGGLSPGKKLTVSRQTAAKSCGFIGTSVRVSLHYLLSENERHSQTNAVIRPKDILQGTVVTYLTCGWIVNN